MAKSKCSLSMIGKEILIADNYRRRLSEICIRNKSYIKIFRRLCEYDPLNCTVFYNDSPIVPRFALGRKRMFFILRAN